MPYVPAPLPGYQASIQITSQPSVSMTNQNMTDSGNHIVYTITNQAHRYIDPTVAVVIQTAPDGSTWTTQPASAYTFQSLGGIVTFNSAVGGATPSARIASGNYYPYSYLGQADTADLAFDMEMADITSLSTTGTPIAFKSYLAMMQGLMIKLHRYYLDATFFSSFLVLVPVVLVAVVLNIGHDATERFEAYCWLKTDDIKLAVNKPVEESLDLQGTGVFSYYS